MKFLCSVLLVVSLTFLCAVHASSCDENCADKPAFTPSRLVVKFGDPTSATCSVCHSACPESLFGLERSVGLHTTHGPKIVWKVDRMTEWDPSPTCYYNVDAQKKCCSTLPVTVYKRPDRVSISFGNHTGLMFEGHQYTLLCEVSNVAPLTNLLVTFYKGSIPLGPPVAHNKSQRSPVTKGYAVVLTPRKEDDGAQFWCEAKLDLGPEGPQPPPVVKSQHIVATVNNNASALISSLNICFICLSSFVWFEVIPTLIPSLGFINGFISHYISI